MLDCYRSDAYGLPRDWQDYPELRRHAEEEAADVPDDERRADDPPAWYEFHNARTGHARLLLLPDLRGPLEARYLHAYRANRQARHAPPPPPPPRPPTPPPPPPPAPPQTPPQAPLHHLATPKLRRQHAAYLMQQAQEAADEQVEADFDYLKALGPDLAVPLAAAPDWRAALRQAVVETRRQQLLHHLPQVFEAYRLREAQGISHPEAEEPDRRSTRYHHERESILDGRELLGEPRDFNF